MLSVPITWVKEGGMVRLDKKYLQADYKGVSTDDIVYTIDASNGQPKYGTNSLTPTHMQRYFRRLTSEQAIQWLKGLEDNM